jgi:multidrug efflux system membrane fusion protein
MSLQKPWVNFHRRLLGTALLAALLAGCDNGVAQNAAPQAPAVSAADVVVKPVSQWDSFNGRIEAVESVQLRPRVSGYIDKVNYTDGQNLPRRARAGAGGALAQQNPGQPGAQRSRPYR